MSLQEIGERQQTDKATYHKYLDFYEHHFNKNIKRFLEIGVLDGASLNMWREWFSPDTIVEGWDIGPLPMINGCFLARVDQTDRESMKLAANDDYDIILDDGAHTAESIETSFSFLFPRTKFYVIEDLHAPWVHPQYLKPLDYPTKDTLEVLEREGIWKSNYSTQQERMYIQKHAEVYAWFWRGDNSQPLSMTCIIKNKEKSWT